MEQLIFDLRGNGGGLLREAVSIVNMFVPKGTEIVSTRGKLEEWNKTYSALSEPLDLEMPMVVLVNSSSASASEIVSGALQDLDRAVILGEESFGKGLVQQTKDISYNTKLKLTVSKYYIPSGRCIQKLDYSHKENGKAEEVPDSLIKPFYTANGRPVFDGRGIKPDVEVDLEFASNILNGLASNNIPFDYATQYRMKVESIASPDQFSLSDDEYKNFMDYALSQDFSYDTQTEAYFDKLTDVAGDERYLEGAEADFETLFAKIQPNPADDLVKFRDEIQEFLEMEIVSRYYYQNGKIIHSITQDPYILEAKSVLNDRYESILTGSN